jgi:heme/copper-type cytochrome/quinol oxidase subunit 1
LGDFVEIGRIGEAGFLPTSGSDTIVSAAMLKDLIKSTFLAVVGTGTFFFFIMMLTIPVMSVLARRGTMFTQSAVVDPEHLFRTVGLPVSGVLFVIFFVLAMRYLRREEEVDDRSAAAVVKN